MNRLSYTLSNSVIRASYNKYPSNTTFYNSYRDHLQDTVLKLDYHSFNKFLDLLKKFNVYIVGHSLLYHKLNLNEYNDKLDLFIDIINLKLFLDNIYMEFIPFSLKFTSKFSTLHENIIEVNYKFKSVKIFLHICFNLNIDIFINKNLSIFGIWYNPNEDNININDITKHLFSDDKLLNTFTIPSNLNLNQNEDGLLESRGLYLRYMSPIEYNADETIIIKELIANLSIYLFISTSEENKLDIRGVNQKKLLINSYNNNYINQYNTGVNASNKYKILSILDFILFMYENKSVYISNIYIYDLFNKAFIEFTKIFDISINIKTYIDKVIKEQILNKYQIEINIDDKNTIKFIITDVCKKELLTSNNETYIKQVLLFYYKKQIYKVKSNYKFLNLITDKHKLFDINFNINTDKLNDKKSTFSDILNLLLNLPKPQSIDKIKFKIEMYDKLLKNNINEFSYFDLINHEDIEKVEEYINNENDNIILVEPEINTITCISKSNLDILISNYEDNWFYDCSKFDSDYLSNPYIKIDTATMPYYVQYKYLYSLFKSKNKLFYINETDKIIEKTATYKNTPIGQHNDLANGVGANHCQDRTNIKISTISTIYIPDTADKIKYDSINKISLNKSYPISLNR
jgi:hypothetical protein